jgi:hypothetical protein
MGKEALVVSQQPPQPVELHTQVPAAQLRPGLQALLLPQPQMPAVPRQLSSRMASQATQATPPVPQWEKDLAMHTLFWQQPAGQVAALHT